MNRYGHLLEADRPPEAFVRAALGLLEAGFREAALLVLDDWARLEIQSEEMFGAVASLQRPSWGMWNGLLSAVRNARKVTLRGGDAAQRQRLEGARTIERLLATLDRVVDPTLMAAVKPFLDLTRTPAGGKVKLGAILTAPISLRNRVAHDTPTDAAWWEHAAAAMRPLVAYHAASDPLRVRESGEAYPAPWFLEEGDEVLAFNGVERDFAVLYVNDQGVSRAVPERTQDVLLALRQLLGKADEQEKDFKRLLSKLAPEEIRGVMMGDWLVGSPVGEGGFARVHVGRQLSTGRKVAVKILHDGMEPETVVRFQQEAAFLSRFRHPNIVGVYGFGQETWSAPRSFSLSGEPWFDAFAKTAPVKTFIALEWIEGRTLDDVFRTGTRDAAQRPALRVLAEWMAAAANALSVVHAAGLIHRDIKPHNLMVTGERAGADGRPAGGEIKLMDFGIARVQRAERTLVTESGRALGTPAYMSPEQMRAAEAEAEVGPASDVYSLAATFYELVTGRRLYAHDTITVEEVRTLKTSGRRPVRPKVVVRGLPWEVETILLGGLEPEPADRYRSMDALERDVRHFLVDEPIEYKKPSLARRARLVYRRNRLVSHLVAAFVATAVAGTVVYVRSLAAEQRRTAEQRDNAVRNEGVANEQRALANTREREARLGLAELLNNNGHALIEKGDAAGALLWYARALPLLADAAAREHAQRLRIGVTLRLLPRPSQMWGYPLEVRQAVFTAALSRDGRRLATGEAWLTPGAASLADARGATRVYDAFTGQPLGPTIAQDKAVEVVSFDAAGARLLTLSGGVPRVYDVASGRPVLPPGFAQAGVARSALSSDGRRLLTVDGSRKRLAVWDVATGAATFPAVESPTPLRFAVFSPDGSRLLAAAAVGDESTKDVTIRVHDAATGRPLSPPLVVPGTWSIVFSEDGRRIAVASSDGWARVYEADTARPVTPPLTHTGPVLHAGFSLDGKQVATVSGDKTARVWDAETGKALCPPMSHEEAPYALGFSDDGGRLATVAYDKAMRLWDAKSGRPLCAPLRQTSEITDGGFLENGGDVFIAATQAGVTLWDYGRSLDPGVVRIPSERGEVTQVAFSGDSSMLVANSAKGGARVLDVASGRDVVPPLSHPQGVVEAVFSPDGRRVVTASKDGAARVWELPAPPAPNTAAPAAAARVLAVVRHSDAVNTARFSPDGTHVVTASADKTARVWGAATGQPVTPPLAHSGAVNAATFSPDGRTVATGAADETARVWDAVTGRAVTEPLRARGAVGQIQFSPDGRLLLTADDGGYAHLWDPATGTRRARMNYGTAAREASFSPDGSKIVTAGFSNWVKLFDPALPDAPLVVIPSGSFSSFARFGAGGSLVFTSSFAGRRLWDAAGAPVGPVLDPSPLGFGDFSPDARRLATLDSKIRFWDVTPETRPAADIEKLARLLSSRSLDAKGIIAPLTSEEAVQLFRELRTRFGPEFSAAGIQAETATSLPTTTPGATTARAASTTQSTQPATRASPVRDQ